MTTDTKPRGKCPRNKPRKKLTLAQRLAFLSPVKHEKSGALIPWSDRMGVRAND